MLCYRYFKPCFQNGIYRVKSNNYIHRHKSGTQDANTTPFSAGTQALVVGYQVWTCNLYVNSFFRPLLLQWHALGRPPALFSLFPTFDLVFRFYSAFSDIFYLFEKCIRVNNTLFGTSQKKDSYKNRHFHSFFNL